MFRLLPFAAWPMTSMPDPGCRRMRMRRYRVSRRAKKGALALLMQGMRNKIIADQLGISSEGTVNQHVSSVLAKLRLRNRTQVVVKAVGLGLKPARHGRQT